MFSQKLINIDMKSKPEISTIPKSVKAVEKELDDNGMVLIRYLGTLTMCRVLVERPTDAETEKNCTQIADVVKEILG